LVAALVFAAVALAPKISQADFIFGTGAQIEIGVSEAGFSAPASLPMEEACGSTSDGRERDPSENAPVDENQNSSDDGNLLAATDSGCGSPTNSSTTGSGYGSTGLFVGVTAIQVPACSGTVPIRAAVVPPSSPPIGLLDPPKAVA
jgi:hypothetical protein